MTGRIAFACVWLLAAPLAAQPIEQLKTMATAGDIAANGEAVTMSNTAGMASLLIQTTGTFSLTWELQCSGDGSTFDADDEVPVTLVSSAPAPADNIAGSTQGLYTATIAGCRSVRVIATAFTSGSMRATLTAISTGGSGAGGGGGGGVVSGAVSITQGGNTAAVNASSQLSVNCANCAGGGGTTDADDASIAAGQTNSNANSLNNWYNGTSWIRWSTATPPPVNIAQVNGVTPVAAICDDPAKVTNANLDLTAGTGNTEVVALNGSDLIYVCDVDLIAGGAATVKLSYGTGSACATGNTDLRTYNFAAAGDGITKNGAGAVMIRVPAGNALCVERGASVTLSGGVGYVRQP